MARLDIAVSVLGAGSMGGAIASGLVSAGMVDATRVSVCDLREEALLPFGAQGMTCLTSADELVAQDADVVVLAVKPQVLPVVVAPLSAQHAWWSPSLLASRLPRLRSCFPVPTWCA